MDPATIEIHPFANLLPEASAEEYKLLEEDILRNGIQVPLVGYQGKCLDGRNRLRVAVAHPPTSVTMIDGDFNSDDEARAYVFSMNVARRHLTASQKAAVFARFMNASRALESEPDVADSFLPAAEFDDAPEPEPVKPTRARSSKGERKSNAERNADKATQKIAETVGVNRQYVHDAQKLAEQAPELLQQVADGDVSMPDAARQLRETKAADKALKRDALGRELPENLIPAFEAVARFKQLIRDVGKLRKEIETLSAMAEGTYIVYARANQDLLNVRDQLKVATPHAVCPGCDGEGCGQCKQCGFLHERGYEALVQAAASA